MRRLYRPRRHCADSADRRPAVAVLQTSTLKSGCRRGPRMPRPKTRKLDEPQQPRGVRGEGQNRVGRQKEHKQGRERESERARKRERTPRPIPISGAQNKIPSEYRMHRLSNNMCPALPCCLSSPFPLLKSSTATAQCDAAEPMRNNQSRSPARRHIRKTIYICSSFTSSAIGLLVHASYHHSHAPTSARPNKTSICLGAFANHVGTCCCRWSVLQCTVYLPCVHCLGAR
jgi:hypothetical protein